MNRHNLSKEMPSSEINANKKCLLENIDIKEIQNQNTLRIHKKDIENIEEVKSLDENISENENESDSTTKKFINKKRGRKRNKSLDYNESNAEHTKFSHDNIKRKVKTHYHLFIIALLNMASKNILNKRNRFCKISSEITKNITVGFNQNLFKLKIKDIITKISDKFQDKDKNIISLELIMRNKEKNQEVLKLLDLNYKDMYINYYLKSTKKTFEGYPEDESFESHIIKLKKKYGKKYGIEYKKNAESLINFFNTCKKRIRKKVNISSNKKHFYEMSRNVSNLFYDSNIYKEDFFVEKPNTKVSTSTQTNIILSEDEEDF